MEVIELLILNEKTVSNLYAIFALRFPELREFWQKKATEGEVHAELLLGVKAIAQEVSSFLNPSRFNAEMLQRWVTQVSNLVREAGRLTLLEALAAAKDIESSLIEQEFFKVIATDSPQFQQALKKLESDTKKHAAEMVEMYQKYSKK